jgi:hypothetical protein
MASTNQTIGNFYQQATSREFSRDFLFRVLNITFAGGAVFNEDELIYAKTAKLPARQITNVQSKYMGLNFNMAGTAVYPGSDSYVISFYCDAFSEIRNKFLEESRRVFDDATSTGDYNIAGRASTITLLQLDKALEPTAAFTLVGANIKNVGEIQYSMSEGTGQPVNFDATISYHFFEESIL